MYSWLSFFQGSTALDNVEFQMRKFDVEELTTEERALVRAIRRLLLKTSAGESTSLKHRLNTQA